MPQIKKKPILVIEDDLDIRESLEQILISEGYQVVCAEDGKQGLLKLKEMTEEPCLILLDLFMPEMGGGAFLKELKKDPAQSIAKIPVLVLSAVPAEADIVESLGPLADGFIKKPIDLEELLEGIREHCCEKETAA